MTTPTTRAGHPRLTVSAWETGYDSVHLEVRHRSSHSARSVSAVLSAYARKHYPDSVRVSGGGSFNGDTATTSAVYSWYTAPTGT